MFPRNRLFIKLFRYCCVFITVLFLLEYFGAFVHPFEESFTKNFKHSDVFFDGDIRSLCSQLRKGQKPEVAPINNLTFAYKNNNPNKCRDELKNGLTPHLLIIVSFSCNDY